MRLVDADAYTQEINNRIEAAIKWGINAIDEEIKTRAEQAIATFCEASLTAKKMPTIEAEPIRHGRWIPESPHVAFAEECSNCGGIVYWDDGYLHSYPFCPLCGAKMDKEET